MEPLNSRIWIFVNPSVVGPRGQDVSVPYYVGATASWGRSDLLVQGGDRG